MLLLFPVVGAESFPCFVAEFVRGGEPSAGGGRRGETQQAAGGGRSHQPIRPLCQVTRHVLYQNESHQKGDYERVRLDHHPNRLQQQGYGGRCGAHAQRAC